MRRKLAASPGSLIHTGARLTEKTTWKIISYDESSIEVDESGEVPSLQSLTDSEKSVWIHVTGLHEVEKLSQLGEEFRISPLILEDILNTGSRPKIEKREDEVFVVTKLLWSDTEDASIDMQQFSILLLPGNIAISFLESPTPVFDPVLERLHNSRSGRIRRFGADYLLWALLDAVVDNYLAVIDQLDETVVNMDTALQIDSAQVEASELYTLKRDIGQIYRAMRPVKEVTASLERSKTTLLKKSSTPFFTDLNDHSIQVMETMEDLRENASALRDFYLSAVSNRMNEVMKVLTCFSTIFLPLTFITGVYGMNFERMPELRHPMAYPLVWVVFIFCAGGMFFLFRKKNWL